MDRSSNNSDSLRNKCPHCGSLDTEDTGSRFGSGPSIKNWKNETWKCNNCKKSFIVK
jgi:transposase-like protein